MKDGFSNAKSNPVLALEESEGPKTFHSPDDKFKVIVYPKEFEIVIQAIQCTPGFCTPQRLKIEKPNSEVVAVKVYDITNDGISDIVAKLSDGIIVYFRGEGYEKR